MKIKKVTLEATAKREQTAHLIGMKGYFEKVHDTLESDDPLISLEEKWQIIKEPFLKKYNISKEEIKFEQGKFELLIVLLKARTGKTFIELVKEIEHW